jgi:CHASE3 domain sensor protein
MDVRYLNALTSLLDKLAEELESLSFNREQQERLKDLRKQINSLKLKES